MTQICHKWIGGTCLQGAARRDLSLSKEASGPIAGKLTPSPGWASRVPGYDSVPCSPKVPLMLSEILRVFACP